MRAFASDYLRTPDEVHIGDPGSASIDVTQIALCCEPNSKMQQLINICGQTLKPGNKLLVFVRTKRGAEQVAQALQRARFVTALPRFYEDPCRVC